MPAMSFYTTITHEIFYYSERQVGAVPGCWHRAQEHSTHLQTLQSPSQALFLSEAVAMKINIEELDNFTTTILSHLWAAWFSYTESIWFIKATVQSAMVRSLTLISFPSHCIAQALQTMQWIMLRSSKECS